VIITRLFGGLGNQMFQYAAGRRLANKLSVELKLDVNFLGKSGIRQYALGVFNIKESFASAQEISALAPKNKLTQAIAKRWPSHWPKYFQEKQFHFDPDILKLPDDVYLKGYWQSEKYFSDIIPLIRKDFTFKIPQTGRNKELAEIIASEQSVSIHIRRGDYIAANKYHHICNQDYYLRCEDYIEKTNRDVHFFVFSDDPEWAKNILRNIHRVTFISHNHNNDCEDMRLMSQCQHHIIANSTFSWWGAWLNANKDKIVLAPKQWFADSTQTAIKLDDLCPNSWVLL